MGGKKKEASEGGGAKPKRAKKAEGAGVASDPGPGTAAEVTDLIDPLDSLDRRARLPHAPAQRLSVR